MPCKSKGKGEMKKGGKKKWFLTRGKSFGILKKVLFDITVHFSSEGFWPLTRGRSRYGSLPCQRISYQNNNPFLPDVGYASPREA